MAYNYRTNKEYQESRDSYYAKGRADAREDRQWLNCKNDFLYVLEKETEFLIKQMEREFPFVETTEILNLLKQSYGDSYKRIKMLLHSFPQYRKPYGRD